MSIFLTIVGFIIGLIGISGARRQRAKQWATRYLVGAILMGVCVGMAGMVALPAVIVGTAVQSAGEMSKSATLTAHLTVLQNAVDLYHNDMKRYPARLEDVTAASNPDPRYMGPYLRAVPQHPYGGTYFLDPTTGEVSEKH